jgi:hypothetical protein
VVPEVRFPTACPSTKAFAILYVAVGVVVEHPGGREEPPAESEER